MVLEIMVRPLGLIRLFGSLSTILSVKISAEGLYDVKDVDILTLVATPVNGYLIKITNNR